MTAKEYTDLVYNYFKQQANFKKNEAEYKKCQIEFNEKMNEYFDGLSVNRRKNASFKLSNGNVIKVTRVAPAKINWLPDKLRSKVTKPIWKQIAKKRYEISDIDGLISYLKTCNVNPKIFKSFIEVTETIDSKSIERLSELGKIKTNDIKGCYIVECSKPYYKLKEIIDEE